MKKEHHNVMKEFFINLYEKFINLSWVKWLIDFCQKNSLMAGIIGGLLLFIIIILCVMGSVRRKAKKEARRLSAAMKKDEETITVEDTPIPVEETVTVEDTPIEDVAEEVAPVEEVVEEPVEEIVEEVVEEPVEEVVEEPVEEIVEEPVEEIVEEPVEEIVEEPVEEVVEEPVEEVVEEVVEEPVEEPVDEVVEEVVEEPVEETNDEPIKILLNAVVETPIQEEEVVEESSIEEEEVVEESPIEYVTETPVDEVIEEVIEEPVEEIVEEPVEEVVEEVIEEPVEEIVEEIVEEPTTPPAPPTEIGETIALIENMDEDIPEFLRDHYEEGEMDKIARYTGKWAICRVLTDAAISEDMYFFELRASNGEKLLSSEEYTTYQGALRGIETLRTNILNGNIKMTITKKGDYLFKVLSGKNMLLCLGENYPTMARCQKAIVSTKRFAETAILDENVQDIVIKVPQEGNTPLPTFPKGSVGKWIIFSRKDLHNQTMYYFELFANNGERLLSSETYTTYIGAINGIQTYKNNIQKDNFRISLTKRGDYIYKLLNANGQLLCLGEHYKTKRLCANAVESVKRFALSSPVLTEENPDEQN